MEVTLKLQDWSLAKDKDTGLPKISGSYIIDASGVKIAEQSFNGKYGGIPLVFSGELIQKAKELEKAIVAEIDTLIK